MLWRRRCGCGRWSTCWWRRARQPPRAGNHRRLPSNGHLRAIRAAGGAGTRGGSSHHQDVVAVCPAKAYDDLETLVACGERPLLVVSTAWKTPGIWGDCAHGHRRRSPRPGDSRAACGGSVASRSAGGGGGARALEDRAVTNLVRALGDLKQRRPVIYGFEAQGGEILPGTRLTRPAAPCPGRRRPGVATAWCARPATWWRTCRSTAGGIAERIGGGCRGAL